MTHKTLAIVNLFGVHQQNYEPTHRKSSELTADDFLCLAKQAPAINHSRLLALKKSFEQETQQTTTTLPGLFI